MDYNGHVNDAAYATISALANEEFCNDIGISAPYRLESGRALYSAQLTIKYLHEIAPPDTIEVVRTIARVGHKSLTLTSEFKVGDRAAATTEHIYVLVDSRAGASSPFNAAERARIEHLIGHQC